MAYKVLGQTTSTAAAAGITNLNLVKDPSFTATKDLTSVIPIAGANLGYAITEVSTPWGYAAQNTYKKVTTPGIQGTLAAPFGASSSALGFYHEDTGYVYLMQGGGIGVSPAAWAGNGTVNTGTAMTVTGGQSYSFAFSYWLNDTTYLQNSPSMTIYWHQSNGNYISTSSVGLSTVTNTWVRSSTQTVTAPSNAAFAWVVLAAHLSNAGISMFDGIVFGQSSSYATTFTEPKFKNTAVVTAPFDKKTDGFINDTFTVQSSLVYAGALTDLYTVPSGKSSVISTLSVSNLANTGTTYRVAVVPSGETLAAKHFTHMDIPLSANQTQTITIGMTLTAGDKIKVAADTSTVAFTAFGSEA